MNEKKFFWEINNITLFIETERINNNNNSKINKYDYLIIKEINKLCSKAKKMIMEVNNKNFKYVIRTLIEIDAKITNCLFFLIHNEYLDYETIDSIIEEDCMEDYYVDLSCKEKLNEFKLVYFTNSV